MIILEFSSLLHKNPIVEISPVSTLQSFNLACASTSISSSYVIVFDWIFFLDFLLPVPCAAPITVPIPGATIVPTTAPIPRPFLLLLPFSVPVVSLFVIVLIIGPSQM